MKKNLLLVALLAVLTACGGAKKENNRFEDFANRMAQSEMKRNPEIWASDYDKPKWEYTNALMARAYLELFQLTQDSAYLQHVNHYADTFIGEDGSIKGYKKSLYNMDRVQGGNFLILLTEVDPQPRYREAIETLHEQFDEQPRTEEGGFWHKQVYEHQMWLDGLFTGTTFHARYAAWKPAETLWDDVVNQFRVVDKHTLKENGLNYHGWDESKQMGWADSITGCSPETWGRAEGWYVMALVDVLELMPTYHPGYAELSGILCRVMQALKTYQDAETHLWCQVPDKPEAEGNYLESTCSAMYCYAMAKGARIGVLPQEYRHEAELVFDGLMNNKIQENEDGTISLTDCCAVAGLGGTPYRDGTYEYYINEHIRLDDLKGLAPIILAAVELAK